jgi:hypothetical protein
MKSSRGFAAAILFLSALPVAVLYQMLGGHGGETVIHLFLAVGAGLLSSAISDFRTPVWAIWLGRFSIGFLAVIFGLQGLSELTRDDFLTDVAFQVLGQHVEGWLLTGFLLWCMIAVVVDGRGGAKILGLIAVPSAAVVRAFASILPLRGESLEATAPALKLIYLLPFVWLLVESRRKPTPHSDAAGPPSHRVLTTEEGRP